ncbi:MULTISPECIES: hypothetical protein [unclassified Paenibacillus]|uniref:hypothetical protein n=1 Tax=unclassified Paenibacillus TaxID=185978 RepID=UPI000954CD83|nr:MULTISPECIES: hypothetical protein [unclassified Paenibacillus]ASS65829.1 hypothetical protein CIC07_06510 [Paenibacillus sp. RUD330]SIQ22231.1 hypothetical protein SAMN05880555_1060 [Paenibacillus sp. RU4X]SIQ43928.1 hypothetical protein SAMN05880570_1059 [Paenibacillus sp. RU4T]
MDRRRKRLRQAAPIAAAVLVLALLADMNGYYGHRVPGGAAEAFRTRLLETVGQGEQVRLSELTEFDWDRMAVIPPYMNWEQMEAAAGAEWTNARTYPGYVLLRMLPDTCTMCDEGMHRLVFAKGSRVTADVPLSRMDLDFTGLSGIARTEEPIVGTRHAGSPLVVAIRP